VFHSEFAKQPSVMGNLCISPYSSVGTHKHNIQTDKVWIPRGTKAQCTVSQTFFHSISNNIKNQLLHWARDVQGNRWMSLRRMLFKVTEVCTKWLFSKMQFLNYSTWHEYSLCGVQMERTLWCCFAAAWKTKSKGLRFSSRSVLWPS